MHLPNEIILQALRDVCKIDLKAVRLVNKQWSSCAAHFLFDTVYISPHKPNIDVFQNITHHPVLRGCVTKLAFDAVAFRVKWSFSQYLDRLRLQVRRMTAWPKGAVDISEVHTKIFIEAIKVGVPEDFLELSEEKCKDFDFIKAGYRKWQDNALYEQRCLDDNSFMRIFVTGLQRLNRLNTVRLNGDWPRISYPESKVEGLAHRTSGSPLARSWGVFDATPLAWCRGHHRFYWGVPDPGSLGFWTVIDALSKTEKYIRSFELRGYIDAATFDTRSTATETRLLHGADAFARLKELRLKVSSGYDEEGELIGHGKLNGLRILLDHIREIEVFELCLPGDFGSAQAWATYECIFSKNGAWPCLRSFTIGDLEIRGRDLIHLLFAKMPSLQYLTLHDISLSDHAWDAVIEALKFRRLSSFEIDTNDDLCNLQLTTFLAPVLDDWIWTKGVDISFFRNFERYVVYGAHDWTLRHPSLRDSQPTQESLDYLCGIFDRANESKSIMDIDVPRLKRHVAEVCAEADAERQRAEDTKRREGRRPEL